ncbi:hypothetical protein [uncultured Sphingomonas sp.]|uniref:hypothetical protein n=1 Tax=uncultured Sphingomonas sp. TaxID=158754 RepID=UPI0025EAC9C7|nr:hypothetical protein [uncultured Sphingomonas sp.]
MIAAVLAALGRHRQWLTLIAVGAAAAFLYVQWSRVTGERDRALQWSEIACAAAGSTYAASVETVDGKRVKYATGERCKAAITNLAAFRADSDRMTADKLAAAMRDRDARTRTYAAHARAAAEAARAATLRMEAADAKIEAQANGANRVDGDWFVALNDLAGLRAQPADR